MQPALELRPIAIRVLDGGSTRCVSTCTAVIVGSDEGCDLALRLPGVSRLHAEIYPVGDLWWIRDMGSADGTFIDGDPIEAAPVAETVLVELGEGGARLELRP